MQRRQVKSTAYNFQRNRALRTAYLRLPCSKDCLFVGADQVSRAIGSDCTSIFVSGSIMLPLNDPGQTKKVLGMLFRSRMRFYCVRLWLCPKHFHFLLFCFWTRRTFFLFFNKQTNERTSKQCLISG